ncbi:MAG: hypothetical protein BJ554DRAFT_4076, partial [Olpidium bornovanus]
MGTIEDNSDRWRTPTHTHIRGPPDPRVRLVPRREHLHRAHLSGRTGPGNPPPHRHGRGRGGGGGAFSSTGINAANSRGLGTLLDKLEREHKRDSGAFLLRTGHLNHNAMNREFEARCGQGDPGTERVGLWREHARRAKSKEIRQRRKGVLRLQRRAEVLQEEQRLEREEERAKRAPSAKSAGGGGEPGAEDNLASDGDQPEELRSENNSAKPETDDGEAEGGVDHSDVEDEKDPFLTGDPEGAAARAKPVAPKLMDLLKQYDYLKSATRSVSPPSVREDGEEDADGRKKAGRVSPGAYERGRGCLPSLTASHHGLSTSTLPEGTTRSELYQALRRFDRDVIEREYKYKYRNHRTLREREEVLARVGFRCCNYENALGPRRPRAGRELRAVVRPSGRVLRLLRPAHRLVPGVRPAARRGQARVRRHHRAVPRLRRGAQLPPRQGPKAARPEREPPDAEAREKAQQGPRGGDSAPQVHERDVRLSAWQILPRAPARTSGKRFSFLSSTRHFCDSPLLATPRLQTQNGAPEETRDVRDVPAENRGGRNQGIKGVRP